MSKQSYDSALWAESYIQKLSVCPARNQGMADRHWEQVSNLIGTTVHPSMQDGEVAGSFSDGGSFQMVIDYIDWSIGDGSKRMVWYPYGCVVTATCRKYWVFFYILWNIYIYIMLYFWEFDC